MKYYFDTSAIWHIQKNPTQKTLLIKDAKRFPNRYAASAITGLELVSHLGHDGKHFQAIHARLKLFIEVGGRNYLPQPQYFIHKRLFGGPSGLPPLPEKKWLQIVVRGIAYDPVIKQSVCRTREMVDEAKNEYVAKAKQFIIQRPATSWSARMNTQAGKLEFARSVSDHCKCPLPEEYAEAPDRLIQHIDAYWKFRCSMLDLHRYNFEKHKNDFYDAHQLIYLADPELWLVIDDGPFVAKIPASDQKSRIISTDELFLRIQTRARTKGER